MIKQLLIILILLWSGPLWSQTQLFSFEDGAFPDVQRQNSKTPYLLRNYKSLTLDINPQLLRDIEELQFPLTDGFMITAQLLRIQKSISGDFIWFGKVKGDPYSYVSLVVKGDDIFGEIKAGRKTYRVGLDQNLRAFMNQMVQNSEHPFRGTDDSMPVPKDFNTNDIITTTSTDNFIDVILATTTETAANPNATATMEAMLSATNQMLADSCVNFRYRLLSIESTTYSNGSNDSSTILNDLTGNPFTATAPDVNLQALHTTRDSVGADLIQIFVDANNFDVCGLAWRGDFGFLRDEYGFSLVLLGCPASTMAHEFGHNLSLYHDRYQHGEDLTDSAASGGEHYGFVDTINGYESVMSYANHCDENGISCDRIDKFSNPDISHNGVPFGLDEYANASDALNRAFPFVANYRDSTTSYDPGIENNCSAASDNKDLHCFIATATYDSYLHPKINILRNLRDKYLKKSFIGQSFIKLYYKISPYLVPYLKAYPVLKYISRIYIESLIVLIEYSWLLILLFITLFLRIRRAASLIIFLCLLTPKAEARYAMNPFFRNILPNNPAYTLDSSPYTTVSPSFNILTSRSEPNSVTTVEESGSFFNILAAYGGRSFAILGSYTPAWEKSVETNTRPFAGFETTEERSQADVNMAFDFSDYFPIIGINIRSETFVSRDNTLQDQVNSTRTSMNVGSRLNFGMVEVGGGLIYNQEGGDDFANSTDLPDAKWLSAYIGFGFDFSGAASDSLGAGGGQFGKSGFQLEIFYQRDPEVVEINGTSNIIYPETTILGAFGQYSQKLGVSDLILGFELISKSQNSVELFQPESFNSTRLGTLVGYKMDSWFISGNTYTESFDGGSERMDFNVYLSVAYLFSGFSGDTNFSY